MYHNNPNKFVNDSSTLLSIIIPFYNSGNIISRCLESIRQQTEKRFEVILINDGSTDDGPDLCSKYCRVDSRFRLLNKHHFGPSAARNVGISVASGNYIAFVDSDDYLSDNYVRTIIKGFSELSVDVLFHGYYRIMNRGKYIECRVPNPNSMADVDDYLELSARNMFGYTWIKAFQRDAVKDVRFDETLHLFEDEVFTCNVLRKSKRVGIISSPIYNYVVGGPSSLTYQTNNNYCESRNRIFEAWIEILPSDHLRSLRIQQIANECLLACKRYWLERNVDSFEFLSFLSNCAFLNYSTVEPVFANMIRDKNFSELIIHYKKDKSF